MGAGDEAGTLPLELKGVTSSLVWAWVIRNSSVCSQPLSSVLQSLSHLR